jgi:hypothetical protein
MDGRNLFESRGTFAFRMRKSSAGPQSGVLISYSRRDRETAREVADALRASRIDYYLDEDDEELQIADEQEKHTIVVQRIEAGLAACTHLMGIITQNTKDSWWVPYEIGSAKGHDRSSDSAPLRPSAS